MNDNDLDALCACCKTSWGAHVVDDPAGGTVYVCDNCRSFLLSRGYITQARDAVNIIDREVLSMPNIIHVQNDEQEIVDTNYWQTEHAAHGLFYLTINAGALRLLVPDVQLDATTEMATATEVIVSRGPWPAQGKPDGIELLFEDGTETPYCLHMMVEQCDRLPGNQDVNKEFVLAVWTSGGKLWQRPCYCRMVKRIPWMKPYKK